MKNNLEKLFTVAAVISAAVPILIFGFLVILGLPLFTDNHILHLFSKPWNPALGQYGIYQMIIGTILIAGLAVCIAFPLCFGYTALMTLYAPRPIRYLLKKVIILMSGVPTVIYGFVGLFLLVPFVREFFSYGSGLSVLSASLLLVMVISPTMVLMFRASFKTTPKKYLLAVESVGGTKSDLLLYAYLPHVWRELIVGLLLGLGKALGDTLIVLMIAGNAPTIPSSFLDGARSLTSHIALVFAADYESYEFRAIFACGLILYLFTTIVALSIRSLTQTVSKERLS